MTPEEAAERERQIVEAMACFGVDRATSVAMAKKSDIEHPGRWAQFAAWRAEDPAHLLLSAVQLEQDRIKVEAENQYAAQQVNVMVTAQKVQRHAYEAEQRRKAEKEHDYKNSLRYLIEQQDIAARKALDDKLAAHWIGLVPDVIARKQAKWERCRMAARMKAVGFKNKDIAKRLHIAPNTVTALLDRAALPSPVEYETNLVRVGEDVFDYFVDRHMARRRQYHRKD